MEGYNTRMNQSNNNNYLILVYNFSLRVHTFFIHNVFTTTLLLAILLDSIPDENAFATTSIYFPSLHALATATSSSRALITSFLI